MRIYGATAKEEEARQSEEARAIVAEIWKYGVSQSQIIKIINGLIAGLEYQEDTKEIKESLKLVSARLEERKKQQPEKEKKELILDV